MSDPRLARRPTLVVPPLQVVTGKGGVGKSTFAAALAVKWARAGKRVLAIELGSAPAGMAGLLGVRPVEHGVPVPAGGGVYLTYFDGESSLSEYLLRFMPLKGLMKRAFAHPLYKAFVNAGPGVRELMAIGKVRDELLGLATGTPQWDLVVLDAGASGHALQLLRMPGATARTFSSGLAHEEAMRVAGALADPQQTAVHVVTLPEKMPLDESAEIVEQLKHALKLPLGHLVVNQCRTLAPPGARAAVERLLGLDHASGASEALSLAGRRALSWVSLQEEGISALEQRLGLSAHRLPLLRSDGFGRPELELLAGTLP